MAHDYEISKNGRPIVSISKEWMTWDDSYELNISDPADEIDALAIVFRISIRPLPGCCQFCKPLIQFFFSLR